MVAIVVSIIAIMNGYKTSSTQATCNLSCMSNTWVTIVYSVAPIVNQNYPVIIYVKLCLTSLARTMFRH